MTTQEMEEKYKEYLEKKIIAEENARRNVHVRLAETWVKEASLHAKNGEYHDMMICIRLAAENEKKIIVKSDQK